LPLPERRLRPRRPRDRRVRRGALSEPTRGERGRAIFDRGALRALRWRPMTLQVRGRLLTIALERAAQLPGGRDALVQLLPADVRARVEPIWVATAWYDAEIFFAVMEASAKLQRMDPVRLVRRASERA